jgi:hypothetical protein
MRAGGPNVEQSESRDERSKGMRELFMEELAAVTGGGHDCPTCVYTTMACCEEGPFDGCCSYQIADSVSIEP